MPHPPPRCDAGADAERQFNDAAKRDDGKAGEGGGHAAPPVFDGIGVAAVGWFNPAVEEPS